MRIALIVARATDPVLIATLVLALACSNGTASSPAEPIMTKPTTASPQTSIGTAASPQAPIGTARMLADGTIELDLHARAGGAHGQARVVYPPTHAEYRRVLAHLGGLSPGQSKPVPPWPDPWDAGKVEAAAIAHASAKGWKRSDYEIEIVGTDGDGNAVVTLAHADDKRAPRPGGGRSVSLRIDPKAYRVVRELAFQ